MRTRQIPSGGLSALAVLLAALALVVVAGARTTLVQTIVTGSPPSSLATPTTTLPTSVTSPPTTLGGSDAGGSGVATSPGDSTSTRSGTDAATSSTTTTSTTSTTSTTTTTTTTQPASPNDVSSQTGTFVGGETSTELRLGSVRAVKVSVPVGMRVTLSVTCGILSKSATGTTVATVDMSGPASTCIATIRVPASAPEPATWYLDTQ